MCDSPELINAIVLLSTGAPVAEIVGAFMDMGFETEMLGGTDGFLIMGEEPLFNSTFDVELLQQDSGGVFFRDEDKSELIQLPHKQLAEEIRSAITVIELQQPIEFGPVDF